MKTFDDVDDDDDDDSNDNVMLRERLRAHGYV